MPKKTAAGNSKGNQTPPSGRGGRREGAGRKPKAVTTLKLAAIAAAAEPGDGTVGLAEKDEAASYAFRLIASTMRDEKLVGLVVRLDCARDVLDRSWGKASPAPPRVADAGRGDRIDPAAAKRALAAALGEGEAAS